MAQTSSGVLFETQFLNSIPAPVGAPARCEVRSPCYRLAEVGVPGHRWMGILSDISTRGAFVSLDFGSDRPVPGTRIDLTVLGLTALGSQHMSCHGRVAHLSPTGVGLQFDLPAPEMPARVLEPTTSK